METKLLGRILKYYGTQGRSDDLPFCEYNQPNEGGISGCSCPDSPKLNPHSSKPYAFELQFPPFVREKLLVFDHLLTTVENSQRGTWKLVVYGKGGSTGTERPYALTFQAGVQALLQAVAPIQLSQQSFVQI